MNYSVKRFVKKICDKTYTPREFENMANDLAVDSNNRYTQKSAIRVLARYAQPDGARIKIDPDDRQFSREYDHIVGELDIEAYSDSDPVENYDNSVSGSNNNDEIDDLNKKKNTKKNKTKETVKSIKTKPSDGSISDSFDGVNYDNSDDKSNKGGKSEKASKPSGKSAKDPKPATKVKKKVVGTGKDILEMADDRKSISSSSSKKREPRVKKIIKTKIELELTKKDLNSVENVSRTMNLFTKKRMAETGVKRIDEPKVIKRVKKIDDPEISTDEIANEYIYPSESNYSGVYRDNELYGPYGTGNYHDENQVSDKLNKDEKHRLKIYKHLDSIEYPLQRSKKWFEMRSKMITASDGGTIVGLNPYEADFGFITKKVHGRSFNTNIDCYHGKKYEEVATMAYEYRMNVRIKEFGLCQHPEHKILGASPDGIVCEYKLQTRSREPWKKIEAKLNMMGDRGRAKAMMSKQGYTTKYIGRMLEIKCPMRRKILMDPNAPEVYGAHGEPITDLKKDCKKGVCPAYYWVQVQLQLECCDLDECDFWQTEIWEYEDDDDFVEDTDPVHPWLSKTSKQEKGAVIQIMPIAELINTDIPYNDRIYNHAEFIYQPNVDMSPQDIDFWIIETLQNLKWTHKGYSFDSIKYYKIIQSRNTTIPRDRKWFDDNLPKFEKMWNYVEFFRADKYKSKLLKLYTKTFKTDYYGKIKETYEGEIMETIEKIYAEPGENSPEKEHRVYARYIQSLDDYIKKRGIIDEDEIVEDIEDELKDIRDALKFENDKDLDEDENIKLRKKHIEFVRGVKDQVDKYLFVE
jgi:putative phage-type endonuclease